MPKVIIGDKDKRIMSKEEREALRAKLLAQPRNYENFIKAYLKYTEFQESTEKIHKWVAVSIIAAAMERKTFIDAGHFIVFPNFYIFIIGNSGEVRKSTSTGIGFSLIKEARVVNLMSERLTDRSLIDQLERSAKEYFINPAEGIFKKQSAVFAYASELVVFLKDVKGEISELLTTFWDCPEKWTYQTAEDLISLQGISLNILGASTPTWLQRSIPSEEMEGGLASRIVFVVETEPPKRLNPWGVPQEGKLVIKEMRPKLIEDLTRISLLQGEFQKTKEAEDFYTKWYVEHQKGARKVLDIRLKGYYARKPVTVWKLAMALSAAESDNLTFEKRHLEEALEWLKELEGSMLEAFGAIGGNPLARGMKTVSQIVQNHPDGIASSEVFTGLFFDYGDSEAKAIISALRGMGVIKVINTGTKSILYPTERKL